MKPFLLRAETAFDCSGAVLDVEALAGAFPRIHSLRRHVGGARLDAIGIKEAALVEGTLLVAPSAHRRAAARGAGRKHPRAHARHQPVGNFVIERKLGDEADSVARGKAEHVGENRLGHVRKGDEAVIDRGGRLARAVDALGVEEAVRVAPRWVKLVRARRPPDPYVVHGAFEIPEGLGLCEQGRRAACPHKPQSVGALLDERCATTGRSLLLEASLPYPPLRHLLSCHGWQTSLETNKKRARNKQQAHQLITSLKH